MKKSKRFRSSLIAIAAVGSLCACTPTRKSSPLVFEYPFGSQAKQARVVSVGFREGVLTINGCDLARTSQVKILAKNARGQSTVIPFDHVMASSHWVTAKLLSKFVWAAGTAFDLIIADAHGAITATPITIGAGELTNLSIGNNTTVPPNNFVGLSYQGIAFTDSGAWIGSQSTSTSPATGDLVFGTSSTGTTTEAMRILGNGNVGIGTSAPAGALDVYSNSVQALTVTNGYVKARKIHSSLTCSGAQSVLSSTDTYVIWDGVLSDPFGLNNSSGDKTRLTAPISGKYFISYGVNFMVTGNPGTLAAAGIIINGTNTVGLGSQWLLGNGAQYSSHVTGLVSLNAGDYVQVRVRQQSGGSITVCGTAWYQAGYFTMEYVSP